MAKQTNLNPKRQYSWREVRRQFRLAPNVAHLAPMLFASHPRCVRRAIAGHRRILDRNPKRAHDDLEINEVRVLCSAASYFGCSPNQIALTDSTTMGLGLVLTSLNISAGDQILQSEHGHYSSDAAIGYAVDRYDAVRVKKTLYDPDNPAEARQDEMVHQLMSGITDATRVVVVTWVHSSSGVKLPLQRIAENIRQLNEKRPAERKILLVVDGVHALGVEEFELQEGCCDFFIAGCHKTLCGPRGTGIIWGSAAGWKQMRPTIPPFGRDRIECWRQGKADIGAIGRRMTPGGYHSYEHRWALADAFHFQLEIGKQRIRRRIHRLARYCKKRLAAMPHVRLLTPMSQDLSSGIVCFNVDGWDPDDLETELARNGVIASANPYKIPCMRFSFGLYTSRRDIRKGLSVIAACCQ
ncbi:aminotransferase class V-fold PLP-dependent enzyme [Rhodopirellula sp. JC639]|uniref:aminotransferase class V-fold PLP-dependent enzyme n=1 Tax=Stieleria mannarensis TaxID=2755585 RepID=UPI0015FED3A7